MSLYTRGLVVFCHLVTGFLLTVYTFEVSAGNTVRSKMVVDSAVPALGYSSEVEAVIAATNRYNPASVRDNREHVGGIVRCPGRRFFYTHGAGQKHIAPVRFTVSIKKGCQLVALWHTHGGRKEHRKYFSPTDTKTARLLKKPFYMADYRGALSVFYPDDEVMKSGAMAFRGKPPRGSSAGRRVLGVDGQEIHIATR